MANNSVLVVGAGVIGLTCAYVLAEKGYNVRIIAAHWAEDPLTPSYTSSWAGAHFRPFPSRDAQALKESEYARGTYEFFKKLAKSHPESSVKWVKGVDLVEEAGLYKKDAPGYLNGIDNFELLDGKKYGVEFAAEYATWAVNPPVYLAFLKRQLDMHSNVECIKVKVDSLKSAFEAYPDASIVINCSGNGLLFNGNHDDSCFPIRGQTLLVRPPRNNPYENKTVTRQSANGDWTFVITRPLDGGVIIGGTKQVNDQHGAPRLEDTKQVLDRARTYYPELLNENGEFEIIGTNVGFRPARRGGVRIEKESVSHGTIVHAYGLGGSGYEFSYGVAECVSMLVQSIRSSKL